MKETTLYLIRHGESLGNAKRIFLGHTDWGLSPRGEAQAAAFAKGTADMHFDVFYSSDLTRAANTVREAAAMRGLTLRVRKDLREIYAGVWEEMLFDEIAEKYPDEMFVWRNDIGSARPVGGESVAELQKRALSALSAIAAENEGRIVCVGTHATTIRSAVCALMGEPLSYMAEIPWPGNASITKVVYGDGGTKVVYMGKEEHLGELATPSRSKK